MYAAVIPVVKLNRDLSGPFDYAVPAAFVGSVKVGTMVWVPWRKGYTLGYVRRLLDAPGIDPKRVKLIAGVAPCNALSAGLLDTYDWIAEHFFCAPSLVAHCFLPTLPKRSLKNADNEVAVLKALVDRVTVPPVGFSGEVVRYGSATAKLDEISRLVAAATEHRRGAIVIAPHQQDVAAVATRLRAELGEDTVVEYHGELAAGALWRSWTAAAGGLHVTKGNGVVVVGTRMAVGVPVARLGGIFVLESDSPDHKQYDQNPRYDVRAAAVRRAEAERCAVVMLSHAPRAEEYALVAERGFAWREVGVVRGSVSLAENARHTRSAEEKLLTPAAQQAIETALQSQKRVLLFHNRRGTASALLCRDCGKADRCPTCLVPSRVHGKELHCHRCGARRPLPLMCGTCHSASLKTVGLGTGAVVPLLAAAFPDAKIAQLDADDRLASISGADIVLGTQLLVHAASELPEYGEYGAVIATSVDGLLGHSGFRTTENAWRTVRTLADIAADGGGSLLLQTIDNESPEVRELLEDAPTFLGKELALRRKAGYPPAADLVAVTAVAATEAAAVGAIRKLVTRLKELGDKDTLVSGPLRPNNPLRHGKWRALAVIKAKRLNEALVSELRKLPEEFIIDRDPEYLG